MSTEIIVGLAVLFISIAMYRAHILIFNFGAAFLQLFDRHINTLQNIERFKAGHDKRHVVFFCQRYIFFISHHSTNVACSQKGLHTIPWG